MVKNKIDLEILFEKKIIRQNITIAKTSLLDCIKNIFSYTNFPANSYDFIGICLLFSTTSRIKYLNKQFLNKDRPTNVLSFPNLNLNPDDFYLTQKIQHLLLGDITICYTIAQQEADNLKISLNDRIMYLFTHAVLHLLGFRHDTDSQTNTMQNIEKKVMLKCDVDISQI